MSKKVEKEVVVQNEEVKLATKKVTFNKRFLTIEEAQRFIELAVEICFSREGDYIPFMRQINREYALLQFYSDYKPVDNSLNDVYELIYTNNEVRRGLNELMFKMSVGAEEDTGADNQRWDLLNIAGYIINDRIEKLNQPYTLSKAVMDYFEGKTSPVVAGLLEKINEAVAESNAEAETTETEE
jgi:hypothetical protein